MQSRIRHPLFQCQYSGIAVPLRAGRRGANVDHPGQGVALRFGRIAAGIVTLTKLVFEDSNDVAS